MRIVEAVPTVGDRITSLLSRGLRPPAINRVQQHGPHTSILVRVVVATLVRAIIHNLATAIRHHIVIYLVPCSLPCLSNVIYDICLHHLRKLRLVHTWGTDMRPLAHAGTADEALSRGQPSIARRAVQDNDEVVDEAGVVDER